LCCGGCTCLVDVEGCDELGKAADASTNRAIQHTHKTPLEALDDWEFVTLGVLFVTSAALVIAGSVLAFGTADIFANSDTTGGGITTGVRLLRAAAFLYAVLAVGLVYCAWQRLPETIERTAGSVSLFLTLYTGAPFLVARLVWAVGSAFSVQPQKAAFSPFRDTDASTYVHVVTVVVMEFLCALACLLNSFWIML